MSEVSCVSRAAAECDADRPREDPKQGRAARPPEPPYSIEVGVPPRNSHQVDGGLNLARFIGA
jgi:hypothetical protein